jgi:hypothetical protein
VRFRKPSKLMVSEFYPQLNANVFFCGFSLNDHLVYNQTQSISVVFSQPYK